MSSPGDKDLSDKSSMAKVLGICPILADYWKKIKMFQVFDRIQAVILWQQVFSAQTPMVDIY
jgi:hypothetical protein